MSKCQRFSNSPKAFNFCKKLDSYESWLSSSSYRPDPNNKGKYIESLENGLGLKKLIDTILDPHKVNLTPEEKENTKVGLELLYQSDYDSSKINEVLNWEFKTTDINVVVENIRLVKDENGEYHYVNKLNTNYSDLSELLTTLFIEDKEMYVELHQSDGEVKEKLYNIRDKIKNKIRSKFNVNLLKGFTNNSIVNTDAGDRGEEIISKILTDNGFKELFIGGNGNFVDMKFGVDLIMSHPKHGIKTLQVKPGDSNKHMNDKRYSNVDWIATYKEDEKIYDNKTKKEITSDVIVGQDDYDFSSEEVFPWDMKREPVDGVVENFINTGKINLKEEEEIYATHISVGNEKVTFDEVYRMFFPFGVLSKKYPQYREVRETIKRKCLKSADGNVEDAKDYCEEVFLKDIGLFFRKDYHFDNEKFLIQGVVKKVGWGLIDLHNRRNAKKRKPTSFKKGDDDYMSRQTDDVDHQWSDEYGGDMVKQAIDNIKNDKHRFAVRTKYFDGLSQEEQMVLWNEENNDNATSGWGMVNSRGREDFARELNILKKEEETNNYINGILDF